MTCDAEDTRARTLEALPEILAMARSAVVRCFRSGDPEIDELRSLLEACVVGAHRLRLRERLKNEELRQS